MMIARAAQAEGGPHPLALLSTKITPPALPTCMIARPRLSERVARGLAGALTLLVAPAGAGKTTLLVQALEILAAGPAPGRPAVAWLTLDGDDNDPAHFWGYVCAAIRRALPDLEPPDQPAGQGLAPLVNQLINALAARPGRLLLVLDDYHAIDAPAVHAAVAHLVEHLPARLGLAIAGRAEPPLPLARLRARAQLAELHGADLRFSDPETRDLFRSARGIALSERAVADLNASTDGWAAGLQLVLLAADERADPDEQIAAILRDERQLIDYLAEEVIGRQPPEVQAFLLRTSVLERLCADLCDALADGGLWAADGGLGAPTPGTRRSALLLEELERRGLFLTPSAGAAGWYRYHHLFAAALRRQLALRHSPALIAELHRRAAAWLARQPSPDPAGLADAVRHAVAGDALDLLVPMLERWSGPLWAAGQIEALIVGLRSLPEAELGRHPRLRLALAWALFLNDRQDLAGRHLLLLERSAEELTAQDRALGGMLAAVRAAVATASADAPTSVGQAQIALRLLPDDEPGWRSVAQVAQGLVRLAHGDARGAAEELQAAAEICLRAGIHYMRFVALWHLARSRLALGQMSEAARVYRRIAAEDERGGAELGGYSQIGLAGLAYERDELEEARRLIEGGLADVGPGSQPRVRIFAHTTLAMIARAQGDPAQADAELTQAETVARRLGIRDELRALGLLRARFDLQDGDRATPEAWLAQAGVDGAAPASPRHEAEQLLAARLLIAQGRTAAAIRLLDGLLGPAEQAGRPRSAAEIALLLALAYAAEQHETAAARAATQALQIAAPRGYVRLFRDEGPPARELLRAVRRLPLPDEARAHLERCLGEGRPAPGHPGGEEAPYGPIDPLSDRELRVLRLIAADRSNQEIASELLVSVNTIKTHIKRIYEKLQVGSRVGAVERARALGLRLP